MESGNRTALVAGASGLIGAHLLDALLASERYQTVLSLGRRALPREHPRLTQRAVDFASLPGGEALPPVTEAFCALGTTMKKAGSEAAFRAVDHDAVLSFARAAKISGARTLLVVTAHGADPGSMVYYNKVKGETEEALKGLGFESLYLVRPSLLLGDRAESRPGERAAIVVSRALAPLLRPFAARPIEARTVARAMLALAASAAPGVHAVSSGELHALGA